MSQADATAPIVDSAGGVRHYLRDVWRYRNLFMHLAMADIRNRFRGTRLGIVWAMLLPLVPMFMFALLLVNISGQPYEEYTTYILSGMVMWEFIGSCCSLGSTSFLAAAPYLRQVRIPLAVFSIKTVVSALVIFALGVVTLIFYTLAVWPRALSWTWLWMPAFAVLLAIFALPLAIICGILNARFRDFQHILGLGLQAMWFMSPVFFPLSLFEKDGLLKTINDYGPIGRLCAILRGFWMQATSPAPADIAIVVAWAALFWACAVLAISKQEKRLIFYLH